MATHYNRCIVRELQGAASQGTLAYLAAVERHDGKEIIRIYSGPQTTIQTAKTTVKGLSALAATLENIMKGRGIVLEVVWNDRTIDSSSFQTGSMDRETTMHIEKGARGVKSKIRDWLGRLSLPPQ